MNGLEGLQNSDDNISYNSLLSLDIEVLDEEEYCIPTTSSTPSLQDLINLDEESVDIGRPDDETDAILHVDTLYKIAQQLTTAKERSNSGVPCMLTAGSNNHIVIGTSHGHIIAFKDQHLIWACQYNTNYGAVNCGSYNNDTTRLLIGYKHNLIVQYETEFGRILRRLTPGDDLGFIHICWAGPNALALDDTGSIWKLRFSRPVGVRTARSQCIFPGSRAQAKSIAARDNRTIALCTSTKLIVIVGTKATAVSLIGSDEYISVLMWSGNTLISARGTHIQWHIIDESWKQVKLQCIRRSTLRCACLWLGSLDESICWFGNNEHIYLWPDKDDVDLSSSQVVYTNLSMKDILYERVVCCQTPNNKLIVLCHNSVLTVSQTPPAERAKQLLAEGKFVSLAKLFQEYQSNEMLLMLDKFILHLSRNPTPLENMLIAETVVDMCIHYKLSDVLWNVLCETEQQNVYKSLSNAANLGKLSNEMTPLPDIALTMIKHMSDEEAALTIKGLDLCSLSPHSVSKYTREVGAWRSLHMLHSKIDGAKHALKVLEPYAKPSCSNCETNQCAGSILLELTLDSHCVETITDMLPTLLVHNSLETTTSLTAVMRESPFVGPLGKCNRDIVIRACLKFIEQANDFKMELIEWICTLIGGRLLSSEIIQLVLPYIDCVGEDSWLALCDHPKCPSETLLQRAADRPRAKRALLRKLGRHKEAITQAFEDPSLNSHDVELLIHDLKQTFTQDFIKTLRVRLNEFLILQPVKFAQLLSVKAEHLLVHVFQACTSLNMELAIAESLLETGSLNGDIATAHLSYLCENSPKDAIEFLEKYDDLLPPEKSLQIVDKYKISMGRIVCLEAMGDLEAALNVALTEFSHTKDPVKRHQVASKVTSLCMHASEIMPDVTAKIMWEKAIECGAITKAGGTRGGIRAVMAAANKLEDAIVLLKWASLAVSAVCSVKKTASLELHVRLAREIKASSRGQRRTMLDHMPGVTSSTRIEKEVDLTLNRRAPTRLNTETLM